MVDELQNYEIMFSGPFTKNTKIIIVKKMTFAEAVQAAFLQRNKMGHEYKIVSVSEVGVK